MHFGRRARHAAAAILSLSAHLPSRGSRVRLFRSFTPSLEHEEILPGQPATVDFRLASAGGSAVASLAIRIPGR